jgi:hypothetical protein
MIEMLGFGFVDDFLGGLGVLAVQILPVHANH